MSRGRRLIALRRSIYIGVEGRSDRAFVQFLGKVCESQGRHLHLYVKPANGGDSVAVIQSAAHHLSKSSLSKEFHQRLVLLDGDRIEQDGKAGRDAGGVASNHGFEIILQTPNLEGLLVRLHPGHEDRQLQASVAKTELRKLWPEYEKSLIVQQLEHRFDLDSLRRVAKHDTHLQRLLTILELDK